MNDLAQIITALATLVAATGTFVISWHNRTVLGTVKSEVTTLNGKTMAMLADATEGRRVEADVPEGDRTVSEQHYVDNLNAPESPEEHS